MSCQKILEKLREKESSIPCLVKLNLNWATYAGEEEEEEERKKNKTKPKLFKTGGSS
jgi:hypothetical protein